MLDNPHAGQRVRIATEYRDEWPVHNLGGRIGTITGISNVTMVKFDGLTEVLHLPHRFLEAVE